jgi:hypothetical protein
VANDPGETNNLAVKQPQRVRALRARYDAYVREAVAPLASTVKERLEIPAVWGESARPATSQKPSPP